MVVNWWETSATAALSTLKIAGVAPCIACPGPRSEKHMLRGRGGGCQNSVSQRARFLMSTRNRAINPKRVKIWLRKFLVTLWAPVEVTKKILGLLQPSADPCESHKMTVSGYQNAAA